MSSSDFDLSGEIEEAWTGFRSRLADRLAELVDDEVFRVEMENDVDEDEDAGAAPYFQFVGWGGDLVRAEAASNAFLDARWHLTSDAEERLMAFGWEYPTHTLDEEPDSGSPNFYVDLPVREADRLAVMTVAALREVYGCAHPLFLAADGTEKEPGVEEPTMAGAEDADEPFMAFPEDRDELQGLVDRALASVFNAPLEHDSDGDVPIRHGSSMLFVRVCQDRPAIDFFADLVTDVEDLERAALEVAILNRSQPLAKFVLRDDAIVMSYRLHVWPFTSAQFKVVLALLTDDLDDLARDVAQRTGGLRFFELPPGVDAALEDDSVEIDLDPSMVGLLELLEDGPLAASSTAALFDHDRLDLIRQIVKVRTIGLPDGAPDPDLVLAHLRAALRHVADRQSDAVTKVERRIPRRPTSHQLPLLADAEDTLDSGAWVHEQPGA